MKTTKKNFIISLSILAALGAMTGCGGNNAESSQEDAKVLVRTAAAYSEDVVHSAEFTSNIMAFKENNIAPAMPLRIEQILVNVGDNVRQGQLLVKLDPTQHIQSSVQLANLQADYDRMKNVYDAGGVSKQQIDQLETQLNVLRQQNSNLHANTELRSPIDGVVTARNYDPGDMFAGLPVLQVMQISTLKVALSLSEQYFHMVKLGMPVEITVDAIPGNKFEGKISLINPAVDLASRTLGIEVAVSNKDNLLRPGMFSRSNIIFGTQPGIMVEDVAIQRQLGSNDNFLFVAKDGVAERRVVTTGIQVGNMVNVTSGVQPGDEVIVAGISKLINGAEIEITND